MEEDYEDYDYNNDSDSEEETSTYTKSYKIKLSDIEYSSKQYYKKNIPLISLPEDLLFDVDKSLDILLREINTIIDNYDNIEIEPVDNNIYILDINFYFLDKPELPNVSLEIKIPCNFFPFYPPEVLIKSPLGDMLGYRISKMNILKPEKWNFTNSLEKIIVSIYKIIEKYGAPVSKEMKNISSILEEFCILTKTNFSSIDDDKFNFDEIIGDIIPLSLVSSSKSELNGIGYGTSKRSVFDINSYLESLNNKNEKILQILEKILIIINEESFETENIINILSHLNLFFLDNLKDINIENLFKNQKLYTIIFDIILKVLTSYEDLNLSYLNEIYKLTNLLIEYQKLTAMSEDEIIIFGKISSICSYYKTEEIKEFVLDESSFSSDIQNIYINTLKNEIYNEFNFSLENFSFKQSINPSVISVKRLSREIVNFKNNLPLDFSSMIAVRSHTSNMFYQKFLVIGPEGTPYENGVFLFDMMIPENYPLSPPLVLITTTGGGRVRFNPNLYANGKVCLSLLGTWSGHQSEMWNPVNSSLLQLFLSIQSLIFCDNPYFNEPGYENMRGTREGEISSKKYNEHIRIETIKLGMLSYLDSSPPEFKSLIESHFKLKKDTILNTLEKWKSESLSSSKVYEDLIENFKTKIETLK